jgi:hypothetical protein
MTSCLSELATRGLIAIRLNAAAGRPSTNQV